MTALDETASVIEDVESNPTSDSDLACVGIDSSVAVVERLQAHYDARLAEIQTAVGDRVFAEQLSKYQNKAKTIFVRFDPSAFYTEVKDFSERLAKTCKDLREIDASSTSGQYVVDYEVDWINLGLDRLNSRLEAAAEYYVFVGQSSDSSVVFDPASFKKDINSLKLRSYERLLSPAYGEVGLVFERFEEFSWHRLLTFAQYLKSFPVDKIHTSSDLSEKWSAIFKAAQAEGAAPYIERFRASDEARLLRGLRRFFELQPEERETDKQLLKTVAQLRSSPQDEIQAQLNAIAECVGLEDNNLKDFLTMVSPPPVAAIENPSVERESNQSPEVTQRDTESPVTPVPEIDPEEEVELKRLYLEELGIVDEDAITRISETLSASSLAHTVDLVEDFHPSVRKAIFPAYPDLIYDYQKHNLGSYLVLLGEVLTTSRGLEPYRIFDPQAYPEHFSSEEVLERTLRTARMLKETIHRVMSGEKKGQVAVEKDIEAETIKQLDSEGLNGELLVGIVYAFIRGGTIYARTNALSSRSISRSLTGNVRNLGGREFDEACQYLLQQDVLTAPKGTRRASSFALQSNPSRVRDPVLRDFLSWALPARHGGDQ